MKRILTNFAAILLLAINSSCQAQHKMMQTVNDAQKLQANKQLFIGKPLKALLKEIVPEIKMVAVEPKRADGALSYIRFRFVDREGEKKYNLKKNTLLA